MIQWLNDNKEWLFGGLGVTLIMATLKFSNSNVTRFFDQLFLRRMNEKFDSMFYDRLGELISEYPSIYTKFEVDKEDSVEFFFVTYCKNENRKNTYDTIWLENSKDKVEYTSDGFELKKEGIAKRLKNASDPYKFYITVPISSEVIHKYYCRLLEAEHIVTGRGERDEDETRWRIWFLMHNQPVHPDPQSPSALNHTLVNQVYIRNKIYDKKKP
ncbi:MAG: hypothetical protein WCI11_19900 [Candidatus Methylumidiphilus sp.]